MKPMKGCACENEHLQSLRFPLFASLKLDGIRSVIKDRQPLSSALKPIKNKHINEYLSCMPIWEGLDGELLLTDQDNPDTPGRHEFGLVSSAVMGSTGEPDFTYWVFDSWNDPKPFTLRYDNLMSFFVNNPPIPHIRLLPQVLCESLEELMEFETKALEAGYEGVMIRSTNGLYKFGEGTVREQVLLKRKPFADSEAYIVGFEEQQENTNEATKDNLGRTKRSTHKEGMVPKNTLGKFLVRTQRWGDFAVGCGRMTHAQAKHIWDNQADFLGKLIVFKYQEMGVKDKPRLPVFKGFRDPDDMTEDKRRAV